MVKWKDMLPFLLIPTVAFYLLPLLIVDTGSGMLILLLVLPVICLFSAAFYGYKRPVFWGYPVLIGLLFVPTVFWHYNSSAWIYSILYAALALLGVWIGKGMAAKRA